MTEKMLPEARIHIRVFGRVQGVGFRAYVLDQFHMHQLKGWVHNVGYDQVETVAEGPRLILEQFSQDVLRGPRASRVDRSKVEWETPTGEFTQAYVK